MLVFASWSGPRSQRMAEALREWLPQIIQQLRVFVSTEIIAGKRWASEIGTSLQETKFGVICVTPENQGSAWLNFEAGACSKHMADSHVCPYILQGVPTDYAGPLTQFQMVSSGKEGTLQLVAGLNHASPVPLDDARLRKQFERCWPELEKSLDAIRAEQPDQPRPEKRDLEDMVRELLDRSRMATAAPNASRMLTANIEKDLRVLNRALQRCGVPVQAVRLEVAEPNAYHFSVVATDGTKYPMELAAEWFQDEDYLALEVETAIARWKDPRARKSKQNKEPR